MAEPPKTVFDALGWASVDMPRDVNYIFSLLDRVAATPGWGRAWGRERCQGMRGWRVSAASDLSFEDIAFPSLRTLLSAGSSFALS